MSSTLANGHIPPGKDLSTKTRKLVIERHFNGNLNGAIIGHQRSYTPNVRSLATSIPISGKKTENDVPAGTTNVWGVCITATGFAGLSLLHNVLTMLSTTSRHCCPAVNIRPPCAKTAATIDFIAGVWSDEWGTERGT